MSETILTLRTVKIRLQELRKKYGCSNEDFRVNPEIRSRVSDQDEFEWESYLAHEECLLEAEGELHRKYLSNVVSGPREVTEKSQAAQYLAA
jgi:hypothetical protein